MVLWVEFLEEQYFDGGKSPVFYSASGDIEPVTESWLAHGHAGRRHELWMVDHRSLHGPSFSRLDNGRQTRYEEEGSSEKRFPVTNEEYRSHALRNSCNAKAGRKRGRCESIRKVSFTS